MTSDRASGSILRSLILSREQVESWGSFPFSVPVVSSLERLDLESRVTFLVGENGSGKSTLMEAIALATERIAVGSDDLRRDPSLQQLVPLADALRPVWHRKTARGFFLRAEDFFGYAKRMTRVVANAESELARVGEEYADKSDYVRGLAGSPHARTLGEVRSMYGDGLDAQSHGESFMKLFQSRLVPEGLYLLDEPEVPLSPLRQLAFLSILKEAVGEGSQFLIATHSPILLAFPGASIWLCEDSGLESVEWDELEPVSLTRSFLNDPERYLRRL